MYEGAVQDLIDELGRLPGVGPKSAQRIAFHLLASEQEDVQRLVESLVRVKERVQFCDTCGNISEADQCRICADPKRDLSVVCVVEEPKDVVAIERTREFRGRYHVLGGSINPIEGIGPEDLRIRELLSRLADGTISEPPREGATALDGVSSDAWKKEKDMSGEMLTKVKRNNKIMIEFKGSATISRTD